MSITEYNGSGIVAMCGKNCVAIASDTRYGIRQQTVATDMQRIFRVHDKAYVGWSGLITDMQTMQQKLTFRTKMYTLREDREIKPKTLANLISTLLYEKRFGPYFVEPIVAGLQKKKKEKKTGKDEKEKEKDEKEEKEEKDEYEPFICAMDLIGAPVYNDEFLVAGTSSEELYGTCEAIFRKDMEPEDLFETISQCLLASVDRDCLAGWGAVVHIITPDKVTSRQLKCRQD